MARATEGLSGGRIRETNERGIIAALRQAGAMTKSELASELGLTRQAINLIVGDMVAGGFLREGGRKTGAVGRSSTYYALDASAAFAIGVVVEPKRIEALLVDFLGAVHYRASIAGGLADGGPSTAALEGAAAGIASHCASGGIAGERIIGVGAVMPDTSFAAGIGAAPGMEKLTPASLRARLEAIFGLPALVERRAVASVVAEHIKSEGTLPDSLVFISCERDLSAGLFLDGAIHAGAHGLAMRIGGLPPVPGAADAGSLGSIATIAALRARLAGAGFSGDDFYEANLAHPQIIVAWANDAGDALGSALAWLQAALDVGAVVIDVDLPGAIAHRLIERTGTALARALPPGLAAPQILRSRLGRDAAVLGAAMLPLHGRFSPEAAPRRARVASPGVAATA